MARASARMRARDDGVWRGGVYVYGGGVACMCVFGGCVFGGCVCVCGAGVCVGGGRAGGRECMRACVCVGGGMWCVCASLSLYVGNG